MQPSPFDVWAAQEIIDIVNECYVLKPALLTRFVINRLFANTTLGAEVQEALAGFNVTTLNTFIRNRTEYAKAARIGLTALETEPRGPATQEVNALVEEFTALLDENAHLAMEKVHASR